MREDLLHFVWKYQKIPKNTLETTSGEHLQIIACGQHNQLSGPDFFNAKLRLDEQLWAGNVEMHIKSSDWYTHGHETDTHYNNVILHVVWEDDVAVFRRDGSPIPTLQLKDFLTEELLNGYRGLLENPKTRFINCENDIRDVDFFIFESWLERLYFERLEQKSDTIFKLLEDSQNNWEKVLFCMLMKNFGLNVNGPVFLKSAQNIDFSIFRKLQNDLVTLESFLMGMTGLLSTKGSGDFYFAELSKSFQFLKKKFNLTDFEGKKPEFFGLRPNNFPTVRISQLAVLYHQHQNLFGEVIATNQMKDFYHLFDGGVSEYWQKHYTFGKLSKKGSKKLTKSFIDLLVINTIVPLRFAFAKQRGKQIHADIINLIETILPEKNTIISRFDALLPKTQNAMQSQSKIQLYNEYCTKNQCLQCAVGTHLLRDNF